MGQYYKPVFTDDNSNNLGKIVGFAHGHHINQGLKLTEHSYIGNGLCNSVMNFLKKYPDGLRLTWAGDYADAVERVKLPYDSDAAKNVWKKAVQNGETELGYDTFYALDDAELFVDTPEAQNLYEMASEDAVKDLEIEYDTEDPGIRYIINETKKEYVNLYDVPSFDGWKYHPLPLLTADGNGLGGGDYSGSDLMYVGRWKGDVIRVASGELEFNDKLGYTLIKPIFTEVYPLIKQIERVADAVERLDDGQRNEEYVKTHLNDAIKRIKAALCE